jgi:hypothetical protein
LSVPNLSASEQLNSESRIPVAKLGRSPNTGELQVIFGFTPNFAQNLPSFQTINEGLITPIVRRKYTNGNRQIVRIPPDTALNNIGQVECVPKHTRFVFPKCHSQIVIGGHRRMLRNEQLRFHLVRVLSFAFNQIAFHKCLHLRG